jgi:hypothetical protein
VGHQDAYLLYLLSIPVCECVIIMPPVPLQRAQTQHVNAIARQANEINLPHKKEQVDVSSTRTFPNHNSTQ